MTKTLIRALVVWLLLLPQALAQQATAADPASTAQDGVAGSGLAERKGEPAFPALPVLCVRVIDRTLLSDDRPAPGSAQKNARLTEPGRKSAGAAANPSGQPARADLEKAAIARELAKYGSCAPLEPTQPLVGTGDVLIAIHPDTHAELLAFERETGVPVGLYVNGVFLGEDGEPVGREIFPHAVFLHFNIKPGEYSRRLWSSLYRDGSTTQMHRLSAGLGWYNAPRSASLLDNNKIAVTSRLAYWLGIGFIVLLIASAVWLGKVTDIFRDAKTPEAFHRAMLARKRHRRNADTEEKLLLDLYPGYSAATRAECEQLAGQALKGTPMEGDSVHKAAAGLFLRRGQWKSEKSSYSLGRSQLGLWFLFAIATGSYLLIIYGDLPAIDGSLLGLLGLSLGVTGMSLAIDKNNPAVRFKPSQGILRDLITGWDDQYQVYRFQAVIVNLLLLAVGVLHVFRHLSYPIFEPTWLAFLGISGLAYGAGKEITREVGPVPVPPPAPVPAPAPDPPG